MNENINLCEILKDCPQGTKFWSSIFGKVEFKEICDDPEFPIVVLTYRYIDKYPNSEEEDFTSGGIYFKGFKDAECTLFPSKDQRDWSKWKCPKKLKFDPNTLKPFDMILVRHGSSKRWFIDFYSFTDENGISTIDNEYYNIVIPYNENTKYLANTTDEAPDFYKYWEE